MTRRRWNELNQRLVRIEDRLDAIHFQLFEERKHRTTAEGFFDERRRDRGYDQAYRQAWRALHDAADHEDDGHEDLES